MPPDDDKTVHDSQVGGESVIREAIPPPASLAGQRFGPYRIIREIGRGGMGTVYLASRADDQFKKRVALKLLLGSVNAEEILRRFRSERQILATLNHPNIATLLDGGSAPGGEPYFVMEYVEGVPLDDYCDSQSLSVPERLALFRQVCSAVHYVHQHLIVHRDLKPNNILVTPEGVPKLLDFGIAKILKPELMMSVIYATNAGARVMTPAYASPEQVRGDPITTASDIYSLGVILYELLTGRRPYRLKSNSLHELSRAICEDELEKPSTAIGREENNTPQSSVTAEQLSRKRATLPEKLRRLLRGDLDNILLKAMRKEPQRRYGSVEQLSEDVQRHLKRLPVSAHQDSLGYRTHKFILRHKVSVASATVFVLGLVVSTGVAIHQWQLAQREANRAQAANRFLTDLFAIPVRDSASRRDLTVRELLGLAEKRVTPALGGDPAVAADVDYVLGDGFYWQGAAPQARTLFERALGHARKAGDIPREAMATARLGGISYTSNQFDAAWKQSLEALDLWKRHRKQFKPWQAAALLHDAATILLYIRPSDPIHREYFEEGLALARRYPDQVPSSSLAACLQKLAESYINVDRRFKDAYPLLKEAVAINRSDPSQGDLLLGSLQSLGRVNRFLGRYDEDEKAQREAYDLSLRLNGAAHPATISQHSIWAQSLSSVGRFEEAYDHSRQALADMRRTMPTPGSPLLWTGLSIAANAACLAKRFPECETFAREAIQTLGPNPPANDLRLTDARANLGLSLAGQDRRAEALPLIEKTLRLNASLKRRPLYTAALEAALTKSTQ